MNLGRLELFLAMMEHSSVNRTAEKLHLSPGGVSLQLRKLAQDLNCELFVKSGSGLAPTPAAIHLCERVKVLMRQVREIERDFENDEWSDSLRFHFATGATSLIHRLGKPLRLLRKRYPKMDLHITVSVTEEMVAGLFDRRYDLALITLPFPTAGLRITPLYSEELLIIQPSHKAVRGMHIASVPASELSSVPFVLHSRRSNMRAIVEEAFRAGGVQPRVVMEADDVEVLRRLVESGVGYSVLPESGLRQQPRYFHALRISGYRIVRHQVLAAPLLGRPRALTDSVARFLESLLTQPNVTMRAR